VLAWPTIRNRVRGLEAHGKGEVEEKRTKPKAKPKAKATSSLKKRARSQKEEEEEEEEEGQHYESTGTVTAEVAEFLKHCVDHVGDRAGMDLALYVGQGAAPSHDEMIAVCWTGQLP
jgi:hypothetical protein